MNESMILAGSPVRRCSAWGILLWRTLVDNSDPSPIGMVRPLVRRESSTPNGRCRYRVLPRVSRRLAEAGGLPGWLLTCAHCRNAAHTPPAPEKHPHPARRWTMIIPSVHITSDQQIFWQHGFVKAQRNHRDDLGHDDRDDIGFHADYPKARHRANHFTLAKRA